MIQNNNSHKYKYFYLYYFYFYFLKYQTNILYYNSNIQLNMTNNN